MAIYLFRRWRPRLLLAKWARAQLGGRSFGYFSMRFGALWGRLAWWWNIRGSSLFTGCRFRWFRGIKRGSLGRGS